MSTPNYRNIKLPHTINFVKRLGQEYASSDNYGAIKVAAEYCGIKEPFKSLKAIWQHGCLKPWFMEFPETLVYNAPRAINKTVFVARKDQEKYLSDAGYKNVHAIGLPFIYLPEISITRRTKSLLVVPIHSLAGKLAFETTREMEQYANYIKTIEHQFSEVVVCVHPGCIENGYWVTQFEKLGIKWISGAQSNDANALLRMKMLFSQFEYMTTNGWGTHIAYALACGAKVSIAGIAPEYNVEAILSDKGWGGNETAIRMSLSEENAKKERDFLEKFYVSPHLGVEDQALGDWLIGLENKKSPSELEKLFGWEAFDFSFHFSRRGIEAHLRQVLPSSCKKWLRRMITN